LISKDRPEVGGRTGAARVIGANNLTVDHKHLPPPAGRLVVWKFSRVETPG